jgi:hypothetical protein
MPGRIDVIEILLTCFLGRWVNQIKIIIHLLSCPVFVTETKLKVVKSKEKKEKLKKAFTSNWGSEEKEAGKTIHEIQI